MYYLMKYGRASEQSNMEKPVESLITQPIEDT